MAMTEEIDLQSRGRDGNTKPLRILIADDHDVVREGVRALLEHEPGWEVCGTAGTGREAVEQAGILKPDVVVLDLTMPELNGVDAVRLIKRAVPTAEVLVFSAHESEDLVAQVFEAGAKSYITKADASRYLVSAVRSLGEHKPFFTNHISEILFARFLDKPTSKGHLRNPKLSAREREILQLLSKGKSNKEAADILGISTRTTETHRAAVMHKLGLQSLADLVRYAIRNSIIEA
jgi:DNA-binding NarL/FixJ family response regulator